MHTLTQVVHAPNSNIIINNNTNTASHCIHTTWAINNNTNTAPTLHLHCIHQHPYTCPGAPLAAAAVVRQRLPLRLPLRASAQPGGQGCSLGDRTAACYTCRAPRLAVPECRPACRCPSSALKPLSMGAPGGSGRLETILVDGERLGHWAPSRCLGCSSE